MMYDSVIVFIFGLLVGSFLNAVIYRLHTGESIIKKRSHCPKCGHVLAWYELIPLISFTIQKGKCRACKASISWQYPLVELGTAVLFLFVMSNVKCQMSNQCQMTNGQILPLFYFFAITSLLIIVFVYDLKHYIIPDRITYPAILMIFFYQLFSNFDFRFDSAFGIWILALKSLFPIFLSAILTSAFFAAIFFASRGRWLGFGDVKLAFLMGLFLGWPNIVVALFAGFILGGIIGIGLIIASKKTMKSEVPFGPFLVAGTFIAVFFGNAVLEWYMALLR